MASERPSYKASSATARSPLHDGGRDHAYDGREQKDRDVERSLLSAAPKVLARLSRVSPMVSGRRPRTSVHRSAADRDLS